MRYIFALLTLWQFVFSFTANSFRYRATAGLFTDDFDLILNPARIPEVKGNRLFTNLANLISQDEEVVSNTSENTFLIGASSDYLKFLYPAFILSLSSYQLPLMTNLTDRQGRPIFGEGREIRTEWIDEDNNGSYDYKVVQSLSEKAYRSGKENHGYLGLGKNLGALYFGIGYFRNYQDSSRQEPVDNFTFSRTESSLVSASFTYAETAQFSGIRKGENIRETFLLSSQFRNDYLTFGLNIGLLPVRIKESYNLTGESLRFRSAADFDRIFKTSTTDLPYQGVSCPINLYFFARRERDVGITGYEGKYYFSYLMEDLNLKDGKILSSDSSSISFNPGKFWKRDTTYEKESGKIKQNNLYLATHQLFFPTKVFSLGIGLRLFFNSFFDSSSSLIRHFTYTVFDNGDSLQNRSDSTVEKRFEEGSYEKTTGRTYSISFPCAFEYRITNWLVLRLGSVYTWSIVDRSTVGKLTLFSPEKSVVTYGDGTKQEFVVWGEKKEGTKEEYKRQINTTTFSYGIGITPKEFISLDLTGFHRLNELDNWKISVIFKF